LPVPGEFLCGGVFFEEGIVPGVGLVPEREEVSENRDAPGHGVEHEVSHHAPLHPAGDIVPLCFGEEVGTDHGSDDVSDAGEEADDGIEADADFCARDPDEFVQDSGDETRLGLLDGSGEKRPRAFFVTRGGAPGYQDLVDFNRFRGLLRGHGSGALPGLRERGRLYPGISRSICALLGKRSQKERRRWIASTGLWPDRPRLMT